MYIQELTNDKKINFIFSIKIARFNRFVFVRTFIERIFVQKQNKDK
jgi:hypothetical protein